jgi:hypothetical protein
MKHVPRPSSFARWVPLADAITLALLALAAAIVVTGGLRARVWGVTISLTGAWRPALCAALIAAVRHAMWRDDSLWLRLRRLFGPLGDPYLERHANARLTPRELAVVTALMTACTLVMTYPQVCQLDSVRDLGDPLFSLWRLAWVAHQIVRDPLNLFDANVYHPSRFTLAYSDAMLLPGMMTAPFFWLGIPSVPLYNVVLLSTFVLAGVAMYVLVRSLTGQKPAALVAGVAFAFYPFRFQHYYQLELLWACWMPLTLWAVHRTLARGRWRDGLLAGGAFAAQALSCVYFGLFLAAYLVPVGGVLAIGSGRLTRALKPLAAGAALATVLLLPMVVPYTHARQELGERSPAEVLSFSSTPRDYLVAQTSNAIWGNWLGRGPRGPEDSFPGVIIVVLALVALWPPLSVPRMAYAAGLLVAFDISLGSHGYIFPVLYRDFVPFRGLRAPGRMSMFVGLSLAVLGGYGVARVSAYMRRGWLRYLFAALVSVLVLVESRSVLTLERVPATHEVYRWFDGRPTGVLAELPAAADQEALYTYLSTVHWQRILNGYSGAAPVSYHEFKHAMATFPDEASMRLLRDRGTDYVLLHEEFYGREAYQNLVRVIAARSDLQEKARAVTGGYEARIYQLVR